MGTAADTTGRPVLLFDADCGFCTRAATLAPRLGLSADVRPLQSADLAELGISPTRAQHEIPFVGRRGTVRYGHEAIAFALATGPRGCRVAGRALLSWPISTLAAACYRLVADHRRCHPGASSCRV